MAEGSQDPGVQLVASQVAEYKKLKNDAEKKSASLKQKLDRVSGSPPSPPEELQDDMHTSSGASCKLCMSTKFMAEFIVLMNHVFSHTNIGVSGLDSFGYRVVDMVGQ